MPLTEIECKQCGGKMVSRTILKHSQVFVLALFILGFIATASIIYAAFGIIMIIIALWLNNGREKCWVCMQCSSKVPRA